MEDRADAIEHALAVELDRVATHSVLFQSGDVDPTTLSSSPSTDGLITLNDIYAFDPTISVSLDDFTDIIGRHFRQPAEGLGFDNSPSAHMWRTMIAPTRAL